jgi:uncharacterized protein HemY
MPVTLQCPACPHTLRLPDWYDGREVQCPSCLTRFTADFSKPVEVLDVIPVEPRERPESIRPTPPRPLPPPPPRDRDDDPVPRWRRPAPLPQRNPRRWSLPKWLLVLGGLAVIVVGIGVVVGLLRTEKPLPPRETPEQRREDLRVAFGGAAPPNAGADGRELDPLFDAIARAHRRRDQAAMANEIDGERFADEVFATGMVGALNWGERIAYRQQLADDMAEVLKPEPAERTWEQYEIRRVRRLSSDDAVAVVVFRTSLERDEKMRWWVSRRSGRWKAYDFEYLNSGVRNSVIQAIMIAAEARGDFRPQQALVAVNRADLAVQLDNLDEADRELAAVNASGVPPLIEAQRLNSLASVRLRQQHPAEALELLNRAGPLYPDLHILDLNKGAALNALHRYAEALAPLRRYYQTLGGDVGVCSHLGDAFAGVGDLPEALRAYREALSYNPKNSYAFLGVLQSLGPDDSRDDLGARLMRFDKPREMFTEAVAVLGPRADGRGLEALARALVVNDPLYAEAHYHLALARAWQNRPAEAAPSYIAALKLESDAARREEYRKNFLEAMALHGGLAEAYAAEGGSRAAFRALADAMRLHWDTDNLRRLIDLHAKSHADDPLLPFYRGLVNVRDQDYAKAQAEFAAGMKKPPALAVLEGFRDVRVEAAFRTGRAAEALKEIGPRRDTLRQLVDLCLAEDDVALLESLLDPKADDPEMLAGRSRLALRRKRADEATNLFKSALAKVKDDKERDGLVWPFLRDAESVGLAFDAYRAAPDATQAFEVLAGDLRRGGHVAELRKLLDLHAAKHADDPRLALELGLLSLDEEKWDKAAAVLFEGMKKAPAEQRPTLRAPYLYAMFRAGKSLAAYEASTDRAKSFTELAEYLADDGQADELERLIAAHRAGGPESAALLFCQARARILRKDFDAALSLARQAWGATPEHYLRLSRIQELLPLFAAAGRGLDAYRVAPDPEVAFEALADHAVKEKNADLLGQLVVEHGAIRREHLAVHYNTGRLRVLRDLPDAADEAFTAAVAKAPPGRDWVYRNALYTLRIQRGKALDTYRESGGKAEVFGELAAACLREKNAEQLAALLAAKPPVPTEQWELNLRWLRNDYAGVLQYLDAKRDFFAKRSNRFTADDHRVRSLVKLGRADDAVKAAKERVRADHGDVLPVLAQAARGDAPAAINAVGERPSRYLLSSCYRDPDLGPLLRSEKFKPFRDRYPEPKESKIPRFDPDDD